MEVVTKIAKHAFKLAKMFHELTPSELEKLACTTIVQHYLNKIDGEVGKGEIELQHAPKTQLKNSL